VLPKQGEIDMTAVKTTIALFSQYAS